MQHTIIGIGKGGQRLAMTRWRIGIEMTNEYSTPPPPRQRQQHYESTTHPSAIHPYIIVSSDHRSHTQRTNSSHELFFLAAILGCLSFYLLHVPRNGNEAS
uniref:Uncharacterized protein n=1 Tax=Oryza meridionalis TaxID=40149 RepID=A0A0E0DT98_9ORYZ